MMGFTCRRKSMRLDVLGLVFFLVASACSQEDDAAAIRELVQKGAALAEAHDINGVMELATTDIVGQPGAYNRPAIKRIIWSALKHYGQIKILYPKPSVTLLAEDNRASCVVFLLIVKKDRNIPDLKDLYDDPKGWIETVGDNADLYQLNLEMRKTDGRWRVHKARLETFKGTGFSKRNPHDRLTVIGLKGVQAETDLDVVFLTPEMIYG